MSQNLILAPGYTQRNRSMCGPLARYVILRVAHAPGMPGTFSSPPWVSDPDMHHGTCVTHVPWCMPRLLTSGFLWSRWWGKRSRHSRCMRNPQFYLSGKRPIRCKTTLYTTDLSRLAIVYQLHTSSEQANDNHLTSLGSISQEFIQWSSVNELAEHSVHHSNWYFYHLGYFYLKLNFKRCDKKLISPWIAPYSDWLCSDLY